jgi:hypothetical protein
MAPDILGFKARQRFGFIPAPHGGNGETQGASPDTAGLTETLAPISAVGEHLARVVRQSIGAGLAVIVIGRGDRDFLDQSRVGVGAQMSLEPMDRRSSLVLDPTRLAILLARGSDDGRIDKRSGLDPDRLGLELSGDLVKQRFVQRLSDERLTEPDERCALGRCLARREAAIATKRRPVVQRLRKLHIRQIVPHRKQHGLETGQATATPARPWRNRRRRSVAARSQPSRSDRPMRSGARRQSFQTQMLLALSGAATCSPRSTIETKESKLHAPSTAIRAQVSFTCGRTVAVTKKLELRSRAERGPSRVRRQTRKYPK